jgi:2-polyprenyl-3-methyl-5-hydroxy-6-metoxy-1,4-benzoquinol methylase
MSKLAYPLIWLLKKSRNLSALSCRLTKLLGKSKFPLHPKHLVATESPWYLNDICKEDKVLDIGCGNGSQTIKIAPYCFQVFALDYNQEQLSIAKKIAKEKHLRNITFKNIKIDSKLPFKKCYFDKILCLDVLEHLEKRQSLLKEVKRIMKLKGTVFLSVPNSDTSWKKLQRESGLNSFTDPDHKVEYSLNEIKNELNAAGFRIVSIGPIVFDTPWAGFIDLIGAFSLELYKHFDQWKRNRVKSCLKESIGFRIKVIGNA